MNKRELRAKRARAKHLRALAEAQAFRASIWSTVNYRHGVKTFDGHDGPIKHETPTYGPEGGNEDAE